MATGLVIFIFLLGSLGPLAGEQTPRPGAYLAMLGALVLVCFLAFGWLASRLEKTGRTRHIVRAERLLSAARTAVIGIHAYGVFSLGWVQFARELTHRAPIVSDFLAAAPALVTLILVFAGYAPIQKRLREALLWRFLHDGRPVGRSMSRWQLVWEHTRHSILLALVPLLLLRVWIEVGDLAWGRAKLSADAAAWIGLVWQITGVFTVLAFAPLLLRFVWDTVPLESGELRDRVERVLSRNRVSARNVLVWQTSSGVLNGALMGVVPVARYVLFTDALLQLLPVRQVEAVAAHEAGHGRLWHLPWLLGSMMTSALLCGLAFEVAASSLDLPQTSEWTIAGVAFTVVGAILTLGFVSRRFELQADAFAVADLSRHPAPAEMPPADSLTPVEVMPPPLPSNAVTTESVAAMNAALSAVADLNGVPVNRFTWRHGTIAGRQRHLESLIGTPLKSLPIDRTVRWIKAVTAVSAALTIALIVIFGVMPQ
ncbi:MAG: M48 family metalloprotease [Phycisphaerales bacterium]|nr:M48 family metalloprotease [Phycisphaerales bacterium]